MHHIGIPQETAGAKPVRARPLLDGLKISAYSEDGKEVILNIVEPGQIFGEIALRLIEVLCERLRRTSEMLESVAFLDYSARLAKLLLRLADNYGKQSADGLRIDLKLSQQDLGNLIASTRESVNRQLNAWAQERILALGRGQITILDVDALEEHARSLEDF